MKDPCKSRLDELFTYKPETGSLFRKIRVSNCPAGVEAGTLNSGGYKVVWVDRKAMGVHRIAWIMTHGQIEDGIEVDHINGDSADNSLKNLRVANRTQNTINRKRHKNNKCGYKGVYFDASRIRSKPWRARIVVNKKQYTIGMFSTPEEAHEAYKKAALKHFGEFSRF